MNNTSKRVFAKISKEENVELKAEKVELGSIDDLEKFTTALKNMDKVMQKTLSDSDKVWRKMQTIEQEATDAYAKLSNNTEDSEDMIKRATELFEQVVKDAKKLGVNPNDLPIMKTVIKIIENMEDNVNQANQILPDLKMT
jgi:ABC-type transporter Mla subunit MlaD